MTALQQAAQKALEILHYLEALNSDTERQKISAITALRRALEVEQQAEPVAWMTRFNDPERGSYEKPADTHLKRDEAERQVQRHIYKRLCKLRVEPLYAHPQSAQQPMPAKRDLPEREGSTYFRALGWNECIDAIDRAHAQEIWPQPSCADCTSRAYR